RWRVQFWITLRRGSRIESGRASRCRRGRVLQHGAERRTREKWNTSEEHLDERRVHCREGGRGLSDNYHEARRDRDGSEHRGYEVSGNCEGDTHGLPGLE